MPKVTVSKRIISEVPGRAGVWTISKQMFLAGVPRNPDQIEPADGWGCDQVAMTIFCDGGGIDVRLQPMRTDSPERLDEMARLVAEHGWRDGGGISGPLAGDAG